jgi:lipopolysaccharide export system protein LptA
MKHVLPISMVVFCLGTFTNVSVALAADVTPAPTTNAAAPSLFSGESSRGPIEITSDALEVRQPDQVAVFTGNVLAIQGDLNLKSDRMTVYYRNNDKKGASAAKTEQQSVSKIEVDGNVFLSNPTETARGLKGIYDVDANEIRLLGNVVLTREENTLKGEALIYNMTTGKSVLTTAGKVNASGKPDRVRALFVPNKKEGQ